ncbi:MAG: response regulator, partial [Lachnospiraceae bacterium]|nr:response regulator [Lachnospiraceae bacterium]
MSKILIVDDEPMMLKLTNHILAGKYEVVTANNAEEALQLYEKEHPDLILTDLLMPGMTGFEMHETLQKRYTDVIPVIYMTADDTGESETKGFDLGA